MMRVVFREPPEAVKAAH